MTTTTTRSTHRQHTTGSQGHLRLVEVAGRSDTGRVRDINEDRLLVTGELLAVADGMGGHAAGEVAATIAVDALAEAGDDADGDDLEVVMHRANTAIRDRGEDSPGARGMGTTLTVALVREEALDVVHVGDSRAHLWRDGRLARLTHDHTVVAELHRRGVLSADEAARHPHRHLVTKALGVADDVAPDHVRVPLRAGDVVVVCSDGLSDGVDDDGIARTLADAPTLEAAAASLVDQANAAGGRDNVTVALGRIGR